MNKRHKKTYKHLSGNQFDELFDDMINHTQHRGRYVITEMKHIKEDLWKIVYTKIKEDKQ